MTSLILVFALLTCIYTLDWTPVDSIIQTAIRNGGFPGAAVRVANKTHLLYSNNYGTLTFNSPPFGAPAVTNDTIFDIASLSKVTGTLGCIMQLADEGLLNVDDLVTKYIPEYENHGK